MRQKGEKFIVLNPPNKTQSYPRNLLLFLQKALVWQINNVIFDLRHQYGICEAKTVTEIAVRAISQLEDQLVFSYKHTEIVRAHTA